MRALVVEGLAKLLIYDRLSSSSSAMILQSLLLLYFHPATSPLVKIRQCLRFVVRCSFRCL